MAHGHQSVIIYTVTLPSLKNVSYHIGTIVNFGFKPVGIAKAGYFQPVELYAIAVGHINAQDKFGVAVSFIVGIGIGVNIPCAVINNVIPVVINGAVIASEGKGTTVKDNVTASQAKSVYLYKGPVAHDPGIEFFKLVFGTAYQGNKKKGNGKESHNVRILNN